MEGEENGVDLIISPTKKSFLQMSNVGERIGIFFVSVLEIKPISENFCRGSEHFFEMNNSIHDKSYKNYDSKQFIFSLL
jgi:hypothetical protein